MDSHKDYVTIETDGFRNGYSEEYLEKLHRYESTPPEDRDPGDDPGTRKFLDFDKSKCGELPASRDALRAQPVMETADTLNILRHPFDLGYARGSVDVGEGDFKRKVPIVLTRSVSLMRRWYDSGEMSQEEAIEDLINGESEGGESEGGESEGGESEGGEEKESAMERWHITAVKYGLLGLYPPGWDEALAKIPNLRLYGYGIDSGSVLEKLFGSPYPDDGGEGEEEKDFIPTRIPVTDLPWWILSADAYRIGRAVPTGDGKTWTWSDISGSFFSSSEPSGEGIERWPKTEGGEGEDKSAHELFTESWVNSCVSVSGSGKGLIDEDAARSSWKFAREGQGTEGQGTEGQGTGAEDVNGKGLRRMRPDPAGWAKVPPLPRSYKVFTHGDFLLCSSDGTATTTYSGFYGVDYEEEETEKEFDSEDLEYFDPVSGRSVAVWDTSEEGENECDTVTFRGREYKPLDYEGTTYDLKRYDEALINPDFLWYDYHSQPEGEFFATGHVGSCAAFRKDSHDAMWEELVGNVVTNNFDPASHRSHCQRGLAVRGTSFAVYVKPVSERVAVTGVSLVIMRSVRSLDDVQSPDPVTGFAREESIVIPLSPSGNIDVETENLQKGVQRWTVSASDVLSKGDPHGAAGGSWQNRMAEVQLSQMGVLVSFDVLP